MTYSTQAAPPDIELSADDESRLIAELRNLKSQKSPRQLRATKAMNILEKTRSSRIRNAAALALADMREPGAKDSLINLLMRPETKGSRGTLLYALGQLRAEVPLEILANIIIEESYEAREEALAFISRDRIVGSAEEVARARDRLDSARSPADDERCQAINRALEYLRVRQH